MKILFAPSPAVLEVPACEGDLQSLCLRHSLLTESSDFAVPVKCFECLLSLREFLDELFLCGQRQPVFTCKHFIPQMAESVMCNRLVTFGAEDQPTGGFSAGWVQCSRA